MNKPPKKYYFFHLLNDFSGSPMVLRQVAEVLLKNQDDVTIVTGKTKGFLSEIDGANYKAIDYTWSPTKLKTLIAFFWVQVRLFFYVLTLPKKSIVYINTLLPFGAALGAKLRGMKVIYHLHEPQVQPPSLFNLLKKVAKVCSTRQVFVSNYLERELQDIRIEKATTIHNSVSELYQTFIYNEKEKQSQFEVLMACSQKRYKGVYEFVQLSRMLPEIKFKLILNSTGELFDQFVQENPVLDNCVILPAQEDMTAHYLEASLVLNLSNTKTWIESFGLTIVEAMCFGLPVIAPDVGGPLEIIEDSISGYHINSENLDEVADKVKFLDSDIRRYEEMSKAAKQRARFFSHYRFEKHFLEFLEG